MTISFSSNAWTRRRFLNAAALGGLGLFPRPTWAETIDLHAKGGASQRPLTTSYPEKGRMILQRTRPPWLETPFDVFDKGVFTPNEQHFVSWHWATFPTSVDVANFALRVRGCVDRETSFSLSELLHDLPQVELAAVSQCAGNSRIYFEPRVAGAQWANGSMSNARWTGVRLKDVLDRAGIRPGARMVRFGGLDDPILPDAPKFLKSIDIDHARDGEVMIAFAMNGRQIPMLNGFPIKLIVPGWCAVYWIKALNDIEVLDGPDLNYWTTTAYRVPNKQNYTVKPGETDLGLIPITRNLPRSFITNIRPGDVVPASAMRVARGIAFGGDKGVKRVDLSIDGGVSWSPAELGADEGKYSFRQWQARFSLATPGDHLLMVRCANTGDLMQPDKPVWNPAGYMGNSIESTPVLAV
jgi:DMSO/TMAO reductase YedYZ molybdopterin-dependent catalytic subunit